ncbi:unnamed protein product, partial [Brachionus calyciflorus]
MVFLSGDVRLQTIGANYEVILINSNHNHASNPTLLINKEKLNTKEIVNSPSSEADRKAISRIKSKKKLDSPSQQEHLFDFSFPECSLCRMDDEERFFVFGSREHIKFLENVNIFVMELSASPLSYFN